MFISVKYYLMNFEVFVLNLVIFHFLTRLEIARYILMRRCIKYLRKKYRNTLKVKYRHNEQCIEMDDFVYYDFFLTLFLLTKLDLMRRNDLIKYDQSECNTHEKL